MDLHWFGSLDLDPRLDKNWIRIRIERENNADPHYWYKVLDSVGDSFAASIGT
jgi:hypothetical protein